MPKSNHQLITGVCSAFVMTATVRWVTWLITGLQSNWNNVEATFDFLEATFDFVAKKNGNNVDRVYRKISPFQQSRNKLNMFDLFRLCRKHRSTCSIRQCCFDIVAGVDGAEVLSGIAAEQFRTVPVPRIVESEHADEWRHERRRHWITADRHSPRVTSGRFSSTSSYERTSDSDRHSWHWPLCCRQNRIWFTMPSPPEMSAALFSVRPSVCLFIHSSGQILLVLPRYLINGWTIFIKLTWNIY